MSFSATSVIKTLLLAFLVIAGLYYAQEFLIPLAIAGVLATLLLPVCHWLENKKLPRALATLVCVLLILLFIAAIGALLGWQIAALTKDFELIQQRALESIASIQEYLLIHLGISLKEQNLLLKNQQSAISSLAQSLAGSLLSVLSGFILMMVYIFLLLYYRIHIKDFMLQLSTPDKKREMEKVIYNATKVSQQYLVGLAKMIALLWVMYGIGFWAVGVKNAVFFAVLCGLFEIVPFVGNITGTTLTALVSAVNGSSMPMLGGIVLIYGVVQLIQGWVLEPLILGPQVKINPLFTIVALVLGEMIWGIPGIVLAIPITAMIKIVCDHVEPLKPIGFLIGEIEVAKTASPWLQKIKHFFTKAK